MQDDVDILEILATLPHESECPTPGRTFPAPPPSTRVGSPSITLHIERDLAIMLIGSDAGSKGRIKPHAAMTEGGHPQQTIDVSSLLAPILRDEVWRLTSDKGHSPRQFTVEATHGQAASLKAFCVRFAAYIRRHLEEQSQGDRAHRSGQRLRQAYSLIEQVNSALGIAYDDGRELDQCQRELTGQIIGLQAALEAFRARVEAEAPDRPMPYLTELRDALHKYLDHRGHG